MSELERAKARLKAVRAEEKALDTPPVMPHSGDMNKRTLTQEIEALEALQQAAFERSWNDPVQETLFHCIGSAFDNAVDTSVEEGFEQTSDRIKEIYLASLYTENAEVRDILNANGFFF
jgi:hypothetical protein